MLLKVTRPEASVGVSMQQVAELTRLIEEDELFQYPQKDDIIGPVYCSPACPVC